MRIPNGSEIAKKHADPWFGEHPGVSPMSRLLLSVACILGLCLNAVIVDAEHPTPSLYPVSWELKFDHNTPQRIVVQSPGDATPKAYWYLTYGVTNNSGQEQTFLPVFEMLAETGQVIRSDKNIPAAVFDAIKTREKKPLLEPFTTIAGSVLLGEDQARDGVAIFPEPVTRMGKFSIFVAGLSGESAQVKDSAGKPVLDAEGKPTFLRKTLRLNYHIRGDEVYPGEDEVNVNSEEWIMR